MIQIEERGEIVVIRIAAGRGNALNVELCEALVKAIEEFERGASRAAVLTGSGSVFGAGVDLRSLLEGGVEYVRRFLPLLERAFERLATCPKPIVAAVNGHAIAGGAILMLACDYRLIARGDARIGLTEVHVGVRFPAWALEIARFATPRENFSTLVLTGRTWLPEDAVARGLADELVDSNQLIDRACAVASEMAGIDAQTFAATKLAVRQPMIDAARRQSSLTGDAVLAHWCAPATLQNIAAFAEKTFGRKA